MYEYKNQGTCSRKVQFDVIDGKVYNVKFTGGCNGNLQGVSRLSEGRGVEELIACLKGIQCRNGTSCPDQLARALMRYQEEQRA